MSEGCDLIIGGTGAIGTSLIKKLGSELPLLFTYRNNLIDANKFYCLDRRFFKLDCNNLGAAEQLAQELGVVHPKPLNIIFSCFVYDLNSCDYMKIVNSQFLFISKILQAIERDDAVYASCRNIVFVVPMNINKDLATGSDYFILFKMLRQLVLNYIFKFGKKGILCNFVSVGILDEGFGTRLAQKEKNDYLKHCSLKRFGKVEEVANLIHWLIRKNTLIQGQVLSIDGGL